jgi:hypothetical protein
MDVFAQTSEPHANQYLYSRARNRLLGAPSGMHDDTVSALMLAHDGVGSARVLEIS